LRSGDHGSKYRDEVFVPRRQDRILLAGAPTSFVAPLHRFLSPAIGLLRKRSLRDESRAGVNELEAEGSGALAQASEDS